MTQQKDTIVRRVIVEYGHWYVYLYVVDDAGKIWHEEVFKQPFRLDKKEVAEETKDCFDNVYQWILDTTVFSASKPDEPSESGEED